MKILAIETSCDDTGIAVLQVSSSSSFKVLANVVSSQPIHQNYGGVFPMMAKREHQANLVPVLARALKLAKLANPKSQILNPKQIQTLKEILEKESKLFEFTKDFLETYEKPNIDYIAVTHGPGLEPCLWVGINFARALSYIWDIPLIPINHIEGHILVNFMKHETHNMKQVFPAMALVVSGGHTQLILMKKIGKYEIIGETRDDAAGECFDKCANMLGLGYPGGPIISKIADNYKLKPRSYNLVLPRPMIHSKDYDFSFSGLKTSVLYKIRDTDPKIVKSKKFISEMTTAIQDAIVDVLVKKTINAAKAYKVKTIILGGGVSANQELRKQFKLQASSFKLQAPDPKLSTDNGLMIAVAGYFNRNKKATWKNLVAEANLRVGQSRHARKTLQKH